MEDEKGGSGKQAQLARDEPAETTQSACGEEQTTSPSQTNPTPLERHIQTVSSLAKAEPAVRRKPVVKEKPLMKATPALKGKPIITPRKLKSKPQTPSKIKGTPTFIPAQSQLTRDEPAETTQSTYGEEQTASPPSTNSLPTERHIRTVSSLAKADKALKPKPVVKAKPLVKANPALTAKPQIIPRKLRPKPHMPSKIKGQPSFIPAQFEDMNITSRNSLSPIEDTASSHVHPKKSPPPISIDEQGVSPGLTASAPPGAQGLSDLSELLSLQDIFKNQQDTHPDDRGINMYVNNPSLMKNQTVIAGDHIHVDKQNIYVPHETGMNRRITPFPVEKVDMKVQKQQLLQQQQSLQLQQQPYQQQPSTQINTHEGPATPMQSALMPTPGGSQDPFELDELRSAVQEAIEQTTNNESKSRQDCIVVMHKPTIVKGGVTQVTGDQYTIGHQTTTYIPKDTGVPDAPGKPKVENQDIKTIAITWASPASGSPVTEYVIEKLDVKTSKWDRVDKVTDTTYTTTAVTAGIEYRFRILARNRRAVSIPSELSDIIVPYDVPSQPGTPEGEIIRNTNIRITWSAPENNGGSQLTGYVLEQCLGSDDVRKKKVIGTTYTIRDLELGNLYVFRISAENRAGLGKPSDPTTITLPDKPNAPDRPKVDNQDVNNIAISWSPPGDGGSPVTGYTIEIMKGEGQGWIEIGDKVAEVKYSSDDLEAGTQYQFRVYAENAVGRSDPSQPLEIITPEDETPLEIRLRGADALAAYLEASKEGKKEIRSIRLMLVGQERVGKTSIVKAFMRDRFQPGEEITDGVDTSKSCGVPFSEPSKWKPLKRDRKDHIKQLDEKHDWGVALAAASKLDPTLIDKSTPGPEEERKHLPLKDTEIFPTVPPLDQEHGQHSPEQSKQDSDREKKTMTRESGNVAETTVQPIMLTDTKAVMKSGANEVPKKKKVLHQMMSRGMGIFHKKHALHTQAATSEDAVTGVYRVIDDMQVPMEFSASKSSPSLETPVEASNAEGPKQGGAIKRISQPKKQLANIPEKVRTHVKQPYEIPANIEKASNQPDEIPENIRKAKEQPDDLEVTFWDFAGQDLYYTTHQVFFNRRAVFALVFDLSKNLEEPCEVQDFSLEEEMSRFHDFNGEDFIKFWLQSIYTYAAQDSADKEGYPPIFIIGTHKRDSAVEEEVVKRQIFAILKGKQYEKYVRRQFHFLENDPAKKKPSDEESFVAMKAAVAKASMNAPHMKEKYPIKWLQFHKAVIEILGTGDNKPYMTLNETQQLAARCGIKDESQLTTMLGLYHDLGAIIWFGEDKILSNTVILDPQWLIDVFKAVITVLPDEKQDQKFTKMWQELQDHGILKNELIDHVWTKWIDIKQELLELMEKFDMVFRQPAEDEDEETEEKEQQPEYCVPACLHPKKGVVNITDGTFYVDFGTFLPDGFFHRVLVHFARWSSQHTYEAPKLFYHLCESFVGPKDKRHECSLQMIQSSKNNSACIKIMLKKVATHGEELESTGEPDPEVCTRVFEFMSKILHELKDKWARGIKYMLTVCCAACREEGKEKLHLIPMIERRGGSYLCSDTKKMIPVTQLYWEAGTDLSSSTEKLQPTTPEQGRHVMISYCWTSRKNGFQMITLRNELQRAGFKVWLAIGADGRRGNMDDRIAEAVDGAFVILLSYSKEYQKSKSCKNEAQYAIYKGKRIIPLKLDQHKPGGWLGLLINSLFYHDVQSENAMLKSLPSIIRDIKGYTTSTYLASRGEPGNRNTGNPSPIDDNREYPTRNAQDQEVAKSKQTMKLDYRNLYLDLAEPIGKGNFATVLKGTYKMQDLLIPVAVKKIKTSSIPNSKSDIIKEAEIMAALGHPHIVRIIGICEGVDMMLVLELAELGPLHKYLRRHGDMSIRNVLELMLQVARGMQYLEEEARLVHRDLAARNVLLFDETLAKISDFGMSKALGLDSDYYVAETAGKWPLKWYAPECIYRFRFSSKSDVWSYGVTLWEALSHGKTPYANMNDKELMRYIKKGQRLHKPGRCLEVVYELMRSCWLLNCNDRPKFRYIVRQMTEILSKLRPGTLQNYHMDDDDADRDEIGYTFSLKTARPVNNDDDAEISYDSVPESDDNADNVQDPDNHSDDADSDAFSPYYIPYLHDDDADRDEIGYIFPPETARPVNNDDDADSDSGGTDVGYNLYIPDNHDDADSVQDTNNHSDDADSDAFSPYYIPYIRKQLNT
ncbi:uncharacterized protein [Amphiura filiformis]|uniref:uncharacterized protein n=1 Tax=Amphiura filiformis TaxID=82378 RepID=UPI003B210B16